MASKVAFVKQEINWIALIPKLLLLGVLCVCLYPVDQKIFFVPAFFIYFILTRLAKWLFFPTALYESIKLIRNAEFGQAIPHIQKSIDYYIKNSWIDRYRYVLQISSAKTSIMESCLCNLAYCYLQTGEIQTAKGKYEAILAKYPENVNARGMLTTINLLTQKGL